MIEARPVLILGMHRSGTSCLAGSLQELGLYLGDVYLWNPHNLKGNREHRQVQQLNEALLQTSGGRWDQPPQNLHWTPEHERWRDRIIADLALAGRPWGFKDPRTLLTLPFWLAALHQPRLVGSFRAPLQVARSLQARGGLSIQRGLALWQQYNERLLALAAQHELLLISFDLPAAHYRATLMHLAQRLGLPKSDHALSFFEPEFRHADANTSAASACPAEAQALHQALLAQADRTCHLNSSE